MLEEEKRKRDVNALSEVLDEDPVYFSAPTAALWMASRLRAYKAIIKHYNSVILHLEDASNRKTDEGVKYVGYLKTLLVKIDTCVYLYLNVRGYQQQQQLPGSPYCGSIWRQEVTQSMVAG